MAETSTNEGPVYTRAGPLSTKNRRAYTLITYICVISLVFKQCQARLEWVNKPQNKVVKLGDDITIPCLAVWVEEEGASTTASGGIQQTPSLSYSWVLNHTPLADKASQLPDHSLFIPKTETLDLGNYTCTVVAKFGDESENSDTLVGSALVIAAYLEPFLIHPESQAVIVGDTATLMCVTGGAAPSVQVTWLRDGLVYTGGTQQTASFGDYDATGLTSQVSARLTVEVSTEMYGVYQCEAYNPVLDVTELSLVANISQQVKLSDEVPNIVWTMPPLLVVGEGSDLILPCSLTESAEPATVVWYLGQYRVDESRRVYALQGDPDNSLGFFPVQRDDRGVYTCRAENSKGLAESPPLELMIAYLSVDFVVQPSDVFAVYGSTAVLRCSPPDSVPPAQVFWYKDYFPLDLEQMYNEGDGRLTLTESGDLQLTAVRKSDKGVYYCEAHNNYTTPSSQTSKLATLTVEGPPIINVPPITTEVVKGTLLQLKCLVDADPTPDVIWLFDGTVIHPSNRISFVNRSQELIISGVDRSWEGWFTCKANNSYGTISAQAYVTVLVPPASLESIGQLTVTAGHSIHIPCPILSDPMPDVLWYYNNTEIYPLDKGAPSDLDWEIVYPDLYLKSVDPNNAGNYTCVGVNKAGSAVSVGSLVVHVPPAVSVSPINVSLVIGHGVTLTCDVSGQPSPSVHWLFNASSSLPAAALLSSNNLTITWSALSWSDVGQYTCRASNLVGSEQAETEVKVMVQPKITTLVVPQDPVKLNNRVTLTCSADGIPYPSVSWSHDGQPVEPSLDGRVRLTRGGWEILIEAVMMEDAGSYQCFVKSVAGEDTAQATFQVLGPPSAPALLSAVSISSQSVYLFWQWTQKQVAQTIDGFQVWYRQRLSEVPLVYPAQLSNSTTRLEVEGLKPYKDYVFYVTAYGFTGISEPSNLLSAITLQAEPGVPENLKASKITESSVVLSWEVPFDANGVVMMYQLQYKRLDDIYDAYTTVNITLPQFPTHDLLLTDLWSNTQYTVQVKAANLQSETQLWGEFSSPLIFSTLMTAPTLPPQNVEVQAISPYSFRITWELVPDYAQNGPILSYHVTSTSVKDTKIQTFKLSNSSTAQNVTGLNPWSIHTVTVKGENPIGFSPASAPVTVQTLPIAPIAPPGSFEVMATTGSSLTLSWKALPEELVTCNVTSYMIEYRQQGTALWETLEVTALSSSTSFVIDSLQSWTWHETQVAAATSSLTPGLGPFTEIALTRTSQGECGPVLGVSFVATESSIKVSWKPPQEVNGILSGYKVSHHIVSATGSDNELLVYNTSLTLIALEPNSLYSISIWAINGAGLGQETMLRVSTLASTDSLTTVYSISNTSSTELIFANGTEINLSQSETSRAIRKNLAAIVAGSLVCAVALIACSVFLCLKCRKYKHNQRMNYDVNDDRVIIQNDSSYYRANDSSIPDDLSSKAQESFYSSNSQDSSRQEVTSRHKQQQSVTFSDDVHSPKSITTSDNQEPSLSANSNITSAINPTSAIVLSLPSEGDTNYTRLQEDSSNKNIATDSGKKKSTLTVPAKKYSKLDEDGEDSYSGMSEKPGFDNPGYSGSRQLSLDDIVLTVEDSLSVNSLRVRSSNYDTESVSSETFKRRSRMRTESAAAIAILKSSRDVSSLAIALENEGRGPVSSVAPQTEDVVEDFGTEVVFNERSVL